MKETKTVATRTIGKIESESRGFYWWLEFHIESVKDCLRIDSRGKDQSRFYTTKDEAEKDFVVAGKLIQKTLIDGVGVKNIMAKTNRGRLAL
jgi:hypothetical protein